LLAGVVGTRCVVDESKQVVRRLIKLAGTTYAAEAGVQLKNTPMPLFQLLVLCMLASKPIDATIAMRAGHELFKAGLRTPKTVLECQRPTMINAFGRASYARYDESSADRLTGMARLLSDKYSGDLRKIEEAGRHDIAATTRMLKDFKGIGDTGTDMYLREIQDTWTWVRPYFDERTTKAAKTLGLPADQKKLGALAPRSSARLAAALTRVSLDDDVRRQVTGAR
jgi:endonuclease III